MIREHNRPILLVEDSPDDLDLTLRALKVNAISNPVRICRDGAEAIDYVRGHGMEDGAPVPALVLLDLNMPKVDGLGVVRAMRAEARYRCVPVVMLSTSEEERDIAAAYQNGANSYIAKGVNFKRFAEVMKQITAYWLEINQPVSS